MTFKVHYELYAAGGRMVPTWRLVFGCKTPDEALARVAARERRGYNTGRFSDARVEHVPCSVTRAARVAPRTASPQWRAVCSCGWGGSFTSDQDLARRERDEHKANNAA
jgi:hypothetical protein